MRVIIDHRHSVTKLNLNPTPFFIFIFLFSIETIYIKCGVDFYTIMISHQIYNFCHRSKGQAIILDFRKTEKKRSVNVGTYIIPRYTLSFPYI